MISHVQHNTTQSRTTQSRTIQYKHNTEDLRGEPFNACAEGYVQSYPSDVEMHTLATWKFIPYSPTGARTLNSGFKDPRDDHFTIRDDAIRVPYSSAQ